MKDVIFQYEDIDEAIRLVALGRFAHLNARQQWCVSRDYNDQLAEYFIMDASICISRFPNEKAKTSSMKALAKAVGVVSLEISAWGVGAPMLIAFIGPDGAGKSTIIEALKPLLPAACFSKEPLPGYPMSEKGQTKARAFHCNRLILPELARGKMVVLDRYFACTAAYQGDSPTDALRILHEQAAMFPAPHLWVFVSAPASLRRARLLANGEAGDPALFAEMLYRSLIAVGALGNVLKLDGAKNAKANAAIVKRRIDNHAK